MSTIERWKHRDVFETYLMLGPDRSLTKLAQSVNVTKVTLGKWRKWFNWDERLAKKDKLALQLVEKENENLYAHSVLKRHTDAYKSIQEKALKQLAKKKLNFETDKDAAIALDIGIKGERNVMGLNDSKIKAAIQGQGFAALVEMVIGGGDQK